MVIIAVPTVNVYPECVVAANAKQRAWDWELAAVPMPNVLLGFAINTLPSVRAERIPTVQPINFALQLLKVEDVSRTRPFVSHALDLPSVLLLQRATVTAVWRHERPEIWGMIAALTNTARVGHAVWRYLTSANARWESNRGGAPTPINFASLLSHFWVITRVLINLEPVKDHARPPGNVARAISQKATVGNLRRNVSVGFV